MPRKITIKRRKKRSLKKRIKKALRGKTKMAQEVIMVGTVGTEEEIKPTQYLNALDKMVENPTIENRNGAWIMRKKMLKRYGEKSLRIINALWQRRRQILKQLVKSWQTSKTATPH